MPRGFGRAEDNLGYSLHWHSTLLVDTLCGTMLDRGCRAYRRYGRWANVNPALLQCLVLGVSITGTTMHWTDVWLSFATLAQH